MKYFLLVSKDLFSEAIASDYVTLHGTRNKQTSKTALCMEEQVKALAETKHGEKGHGRDPSSMYLQVRCARKMG